MAETTEPYEELPYDSVTIEWTAPERLALASLLHGGPRVPVSGYRYLELGCGPGANLRALAYYRRDAEFVGIDGAARHVEQATDDTRALGLDHLRFLHGGFTEAVAELDGQFDFVVAHGVFSWVSPTQAQELLSLMADRVRPGGLVYVGYNTRPGWNVRGLVREHLLGQTAEVEGVRKRAERARAVAASLAAALDASESPYSKLLAGEFRLAAEMGPSYVAHEYLAPENHAYWRSEFCGMAQRCGLQVVADADFYCDSGRLPHGLEDWLEQQDLVGRSLDDTVDLLCYRQHHCPVLSRRPLERRPPSGNEFGELVLASSLTPKAGDGPRDFTVGVEFAHRGGRELTVYKEELDALLRASLARQPRGVRIADLVSDVTSLVDDLRILAAGGLVELRLREPDDFADGGELNQLQRLEAREHGVVTCARHVRHSVQGQT